MSPRHCCWLPPRDDNIDNSDPPEVNHPPHPAEWEITYGPEPHQFTDSCGTHLGEMVEPGAVNTLIPILQEA